MLRKPLNSSLRIKFPFTCHELKWSRDPFRFIVPSMVGMSGRFYIERYQHWLGHNESVLSKHVLQPRKTGLITFGNHQCFIDDCFIWTSLPYLFHLRWRKHRWVLGSADVCFHKFIDQPLKQKLITWFFCAGKTIPITHGDGIFAQPGLDWAIERLKQGDWINLYPEGEVNKTGDWMRFYWGIGRLIQEAPGSTILPFYHIGLDQIYPPDLDPDKRKFHKNKAVTMLWGDPITFPATDKTDDVETDLLSIQKITERLQVVLQD